MSYQSWHKQHSIKHKQIVDKLSHLNIDEIIKYFDYENMKIKEKDFCVLYSQNKKCHDTNELNCYLCACPNFRVDQHKSSCAINSKYGSNIESKNGYIHQDCSGCTVPHSVNYTKKHFDKNWSNIMNKTFI